MLAVSDIESAVQGRDPEEGPRAVAHFRQLTEVLEADRVAAARSAGWSWQDIALPRG